MRERARRVEHRPDAFERAIQLPRIVDARDTPLHVEILGDGPDLLFASTREDGREALLAGRVREQPPRVSTGSVEEELVRHRARNTPLRALLVQRPKRLFDDDVLTL